MRKEWEGPIPRVCFETSEFSKKPVELFVALTHLLRQGAHDRLISVNSVFPVVK
jgi:hypothetical protein